MKYLQILIIVLFFSSCDEKSNVEKEIEKIPVNVEIIRFDKIFATANTNNLAAMKTEYPVFFPSSINDSIWLEKSNDTLQNKLEAEVEKVFPNNDKLEDALIPLFQHIKYYFPQFEVPKVYASTSDVDYENKVIIADSIMVIALDNYLGSNHEFYEGIPLYIAATMNAEQIAPNVAEQFSRTFVMPPKDRTLLSQIIYFGKELYLKDLWLPNVKDEDKIGYSAEQYAWVQENEEQMWRYFVEQEILYSTDPKLFERFVAIAPFSKFYLEIDNESPGMVGRYLGWQIVRAYMQNNNALLSELMTANADEIFKESKYKPKK